MQNVRNNSGIRKLTQKYRTIFRTPENLNHYSREDFHMAERKFLKHALEDGIYIKERKSAANRIYFI